MRIGLAIELGGRPGWLVEPPTYDDLRARAHLAEEVGFDLVMVDDQLSSPLEDVTVGGWSSVAVLAALAQATSRIDLGHSVVNAPYRHPGILAQIAATLDEISGGRFYLGIGAGNTPDADYESFGILADPRYSRFVETLQIVHDLLRTGTSTFDGTYHATNDAELPLRGPRKGDIPIIVAAGGPRMMRTAARLADGWNWWAMPFADPADMRPRIDELERACDEVGRDPATLDRSLDLYFPVAPVGWDRQADGDPPPATAEQTAEALLAYGDLGVTEVRCYLPRRNLAHADRLPAVEAMADVVRLLHAA
jgi:alkanesulfonate monooxygenase SsuD/methylene tetrahydromethanopterin reductase-like flavin-dependent oxidoreductase (luciferase family)